MRFLLATLLTGLLLWAAAFAVFFGTMMLPAADPDEKTDVLIVLTGGNARVERGLTLLAEGAAPVLFISGVGHNVTMAEMLAAHTKPEKKNAILKSEAEIVFDYAASSTQTNAREAAAFVKKRRYRSVRLITGHYHMPRSLVEFRAALPGVKIIREPVVPETFNGNWWRDASARTLIFAEFHKYLAASARVLLHRT